MTDPSELSAFQAGIPFPFDPFQLDACRALEGGAGVLVAAPTGAGKTIVGEFAVHLALARGRKCFYTTPIKALSNQKFADLSRRHGADKVGLLTGDNSINSEAPVVVMTTEVLRNMLYAGSQTLRGLEFVVMDEVHYLADKFRGAAWEEVIIHLPESVTLVSLSATVSNAEEFGEWLQTVRGHTEVIVSEHRPVPLWQHVMVGDTLSDLFVDGNHQRINPDLLRLVGSGGPRDRRRGPPPRSGAQRRSGGAFTPTRPEVIIRLDREALLPAITFIFSRAGCDGAVEQCLRAGLRLNSAEERREVRKVVDAAVASIPDADLVVLGFEGWRDGLERGVAAHHAGMLPAFREVVEALFVRGLVKAVFATETLALGINMPARSVVMEKLVKWNGEAHADVTPGEYTQLTGRAGRRGIDVEGHAVVLWNPHLDPIAVGGLASTRTYPLRSSFRPSYNMAINLVGQLGRERARGLLETSFAQFQADRSVVSVAAQIRKQDEGLAGYAEAATCHLGDFTDYHGLRTALTAREKELSRNRSGDRRAEAAASLEKLRKGDIIVIPVGRFAGVAVVVDPGLSPGPEDPRPAVVTADRQYRRLSLADFPGPVEPLDRVRIPKSFNPRSPQSRRDLASTLRTHADTPVHRQRRNPSAAPDDAEIARLRREIKAHLCHSCPERDDHVRWASRHQRLAADTDKLRAHVAGRTATVARTFDRVCGVLDDLQYLDGDRVSPSGERLKRLYTELDLLAAECLRQGLWNGLTHAELAACVSALAYESRNADDAALPRLPDGPVRETLADMVRVWGDLERVEKRHRLDFLRQPDLGFVWAAYRWANGKGLETVLRDADLTAGDFVRWTKQLIDLLGQVAKVADGDLRATADQAINSLRRGVVVYSSVT
ncbi:DEAD/DEAH box helicase [Sporichthya sp.]|uniref:DEAD/DEAH box helicase n=1 Tax=Sporichthya sp. TaxID=65475 RepID=UPI0017D7B07D|nr:DEAD/DEAH box helicase [Sporichthya sp.]MBA3742129.1 DEAD/DEAH box helicase [Sporichthya sp.]